MENSLYNKLFKRKELAEFNRIELLKSESQQYHLGMYRTRTGAAVKGNTWHKTIRSLHDESDKLEKSKYPRTLIDIFTISEYELKEDMEKHDLTLNQVLSSVV